MRPGPNKRPRGRNNGNNPHHHRGRMPHRAQTFESNGPNVKIRGNAYQIFERYVALAREAALSGDRIAAENLYQHAEHYFRIMNANGEGQPHAPRPTTPADNEMGPEPDAGDPSPSDATAHEQRDAEPRPDDYRAHDGRQQESRAHEPRPQDTRGQDTRGQDTRGPDGRPQDTRPQDPRPQ